MAEATAKKEAAVSSPPEPTYDLEQVLDDPAAFGLSPAELGGILAVGGFGESKKLTMGAVERAKIAFVNRTVEGDE